jgi:HD-GYP domain-containing protein (c-di-GMP phosphodiesterase class II)
MISLNELKGLGVTYALYACIGSLLLLVTALFFIRWQSRRLHYMKEEANRANLLLENIKAAKGIEKNVDFLLEQIGGLIDSPVYAFYIFDSRNKQYILKGVRHRESDFGKVRPSYSGLASYKKEAYMPPISLMATTLPSQSELIVEGEVPLLFVPLGTMGAVRIGPVNKVSSKTKRALDKFAVQIQYILPELVLSESMRNQVEVVVASGKALQNISDIAIDSKVTLEMMLGASVNALGAFGAVYYDRGQSDWKLRSIIGLQEGLRAEIEQEKTLLSFMRGQTEVKSCVILQQGDEAFYELPPLLAAQGTQALVIVEVGDQGILMFLFKKHTDMNSKETGHYSMIASDLLRIIHAQAPIKDLSKVYISILKNLTRMLDKSNRYTVGYSDQMSRFSIVIAKQMGLPEEDIRDIALAAYLSNIGVLGLSSELYQKEGKYTEAEYEMMKLHSEVGASIIRVTTGNKKIASYILHHHERVDGAGYPAGLRGAEIPDGAKIIAVVQTFLAKINGRAQRTPLAFDKALHMLEAASGTQLDKQVVDAFIKWYHDKRIDPLMVNKSLGNCWEMCCTPSSICEHCPVYHQSQSSDRVNCWEVQGNHCSSHGKSCSSCFVHTEYMTRSAVVV